METLKRVPVKNPRVKTIEYIGRIYATIDGQRFWEIDRSVLEVMKMCDGTRTVEDIAREIARIIEASVESVIPTLVDMLTELEKNGLIFYKNNEEDKKN